MALFGFFKRFKKSTVRDLESLAEDIKGIERRIGGAIELRSRIIIRISEAVEILKGNPNDESARRHLVRDLGIERRFLRRVRDGIKDSITTLETTLRELKKAQIDLNIKNKELKTIQYLIDSMQFVKGKIKIIEKRIKKGERLESKGYAAQHLDEFMQTMVEEEEIDREMGLVLEGKSKKVRSKLNILKYMVKDKYIFGTGLAISTVGGGASAHQIGPEGIPTDDALMIIGVIIIASIGIMLALAADTYKHEESRRKGLGKVGKILKIPK